MGSPLYVPPHQNCQCYNAVIPAKAGIHLATDSAVDRWIPAFAGMTFSGYDNSFCSRVAIVSAGLSVVKVALKRPSGSIT